MLRLQVKPDYILKSQQSSRLQHRVNSKQQATSSPRSRSPTGSNSLRTSNGVQQKSISHPLPPPQPQQQPPNLLLSHLIFQQNRLAPPIFPFGMPAPPPPPPPPPPPVPAPTPGAAAAAAAAASVPSLSPMLILPFFVPIPIPLPLFVPIPEKKLEAAKKESFEEKSEDGENNRGQFVLEHSRFLRIFTLSPPFLILPIGFHRLLSEYVVLHWWFSEIFPIFPPSLPCQIEKTVSFHSLWPPLASMMAVRG